MSGYVPYAKLTTAQAAAVAALHPDWKPEYLSRFEFWVTKAGNASRKKGHHRPTGEAAKAMFDELGGAVSLASSANTGPTPTKDAPRRYTGSPAMHLGSNKD